MTATTMAVRGSSRRRHAIWAVLGQLWRGRSPDPGPEETAAPAPTPDTRRDLHPDFPAPQNLVTGPTRATKETLS
jgi:hypothetical protein